MRIVLHILHLQEARSLKDPVILLLHVQKEVMKGQVIHLLKGVNLQGAMTGRVTHLHPEMILVEAILPPAVIILLQEVPAEAVPALAQEVNLTKKQVHNHGVIMHPF